MMTHELGQVYQTPDGTLVSVVEDHGPLVVVLVLQDNPKFTKPMKPGSLFHVFVDTVYWTDSVPFSSLPEQGKVKT